MKILHYPNDSLRQKTQAIEKVTPELQKIAKEMYTVMIFAKGIGLAATQVGLNIRLLVLDNSGSPLYMFNPVIIEQSKEKIVGIEGCLSFPNKWIELKRSTEVKAKYRDSNNKMQFIKLNGLLARAFLHEYDHLQGTLFIDYEPPTESGV